MSFARSLEPTPRGPSDVYIYHDVNGQYLCYACLLAGGEDWTAARPDEMIAHVQDHLAAGHPVPTRTIPALRAEAGGPDAEN